MATKIRLVTVTAAVKTALAALGERKTKTAMRRLGLASRAAMLREYRNYKAVHEWGNDAGEKYPAQIARVYVLEMVHALPKELDALSAEDIDGTISTFRYCLDELAEALPRALQRPLTKEEITAIKEANEAEDARRQAAQAEFSVTWAAEEASIKFAEWICGEVEDCRFESAAA
jgi:hypothetical protein